jgi:hypothetical protein
VAIHLFQDDDVDNYYDSLQQDYSRNATDMCETAAFPRKELEDTHELVDPW